MRNLLWFLVVLVVGCGGSEAAPSGDTNVDAMVSETPEDASPEATDDASSDGTSDAGDADAPVADAGALRRCPTTGKGAVASDECFLLTAVETGLPASGANAHVDQYALRPTSGARGRLVVFFNGSGGTPLAGTRGSPTASFYATARAAGLHVLAVAYRSDDSVGGLCKGDDACFLPTRRTIMTGVYEAGAAPALAGIAVHEGALARIVAALDALAARDPSGGWDAFVDPSAKPRIRWSNVIAAGHSQGGGHAAVLGKAFALDRVVALSSPCDLTKAGTPASWLDASTSPYATSPAAAFHGLGAAGDATCSGYPAIWSALGLDASRRHGGAVVCAGATAHSASIECVENAATWAKMLE